jgi:cytochrome c553
MKNTIKIILLCGFLVNATAVSAADIEAGKQKAQGCAACHGADGNGAATIYPRLAGQYADYLLVSLKRYKSGERQNPMMNAMAGPLSEQDMEDIAAYFSQLPGKLGLPARE